MPLIIYVVIAVALVSVSASPPRVDRATSMCASAEECSAEAAETDGLLQKAGRNVIIENATTADLTEAELGGQQKLKEKAMLFLHDSATGYMGHGDLRNAWVTTQTVDFASQLSCGARALDLRLWYTEGDVRFVHGPMVMWDQTVASTMPSIVSWASDHPNELVLLVVSHCRSGDVTVKGRKVPLVSPTDLEPCSDIKYTRPFTAAGIYVETDCNKVNTMTTADAMDRSLMTAGGHVMAVTECVRENWDSTIKWGQRSCPDNLQTGSDWQKLWTYVDGVVGVGSGNRGLSAVQAFWQMGLSDESPAAMYVQYNTKRYNEQSTINAQIVTQIDAGRFNGVNLLEINNICNRGSDIAKKIGTIVSDNDQAVCNQACQVTRDDEAHGSCIASDDDRCCDWHDSTCCGTCTHVDASGSTQQQTCTHKSSWWSRRRRGNVNSCNNCPGDHGRNNFGGCFKGWHPARKWHASKWTPGGWKC